MLSAAFASKSSHKYIQPRLPLADNIVSHSIPSEVFLRILNHYGGLSAFQSEIMTKYYYENMILEVNSQRDAKCYIICRRDHDTDEKGVEFVGEHRLILAPMCFPLSKDYHHERQSIILTLGALELEVLLPNILDPKQRTGEITKVIANLETETEPEMETNHISLSYKIHVEHGTTRDVLEEYIECASI